ncbi:MAG: BatA domain-containing protein [Flavobacteriia bacterium]|nr:BatA domain-containing protein [Flavobacteriia bacterium]
MEFLNPALLWGLLGISIPILIHLLQLKRYKTVFFSDIRFLKNVQKSARKQQRIRHWLILLLRIAAWSLLTLAFALPFIPSGEKQTKQRNEIVLYVDNSPSMTRKASSGPMWVVAIEAAQDIINKNPNATYHIISASSDGADAIPLTSNAAQKAVQAIQPTQNSLSWTDVLRRISTYGIVDTTQVYMLTDGQETSLQGLNTIDLPIELMPILIQPVGKSANLTIDSVWVNSPVILPNQSIELGYSIINYGDSEVEVPTELWVNDELRGAKSHQIDSEGKLESSITFQVNSSESQRIELRIQDEAINYDDSYFITANVREDLSILHIYDSSSETLPVSELISDSTVEIESNTYSQIPYGRLASFDLIILDRTSESWPSGLASGLNSAVEDGTSALILPYGPSNQDLSALQIAGFGSADTVNISNVEVNYRDEFYYGVFYEDPKRIQLPTLDTHFPISDDYVVLGGSNLLQSASGAPSLVRYQRGFGQIYQWNSHPVADQNGWSELYVPLIYQMAIYKGQPEWFSFQLGKASSFLVEMEETGGDDVVRLKQDSLEVIPQQRQLGARTEINLFATDLAPGFAELVTETKRIGTIALNTPAAESNPMLFTGDQLKSILSENGFSFTVSELDDESQVSAVLSSLYGDEQDSKWWILAAIGVLLLEMILWRQPKS